MASASLLRAPLGRPGSPPPKQRHTAKRIFERLRIEHGFAGGYTVVKDYVRLTRTRSREVFIPLSHPPGHAQVDFGECIGVIGGYHRHPETKFLHADTTDSGPTKRRHILVATIEDIGKEADKWDEDEPLGADDDFTVSYGLSVDDRKRMLAVIQSVSKTRLHRAADISIRTIPSSLAEANELPDKLRRIFAEASTLSEEKRKTADTDEMLLQWLVQQVNERRLKVMAELLEYDAANLAKVVARKRRMSRELRKRIGEQLAAEGRDC